MKDFWDKRYAEKEMAYGKEPNQFFKSQLLKLETGTILLPAEGEGRNAVYSATLGWKVSAFDISEVGKNKADLFAKKSNVSIDYKVGGFEEALYEKESFDCIGLIYAHLPAQFRSAYHKTINNYLKKGGILILEGFSKKQLEYNSKNPKAGGPKKYRYAFLHRRN